MNLLWPIDLESYLDEGTFFEAIGAIKVLHPSELYIKNTINVLFNTTSNSYLVSGWASYDSFRFAKFPKANLRNLKCRQTQIENLNKLLRYYQKTFRNQKYFTKAIDYYLNSFDINNLEMSFLCLCICLETIVPGGEQLSYRLRRNITVLISKTKGEGRKLLKEVKEIYNHRSKLVHDGVSFYKVPNYLDVYAKLENIASKMITEMLLHNIPLHELDESISELGFGQGKSISSNYRHTKTSL